MSERDDDLDFDFFEDEPSTQETAVGGRVVRKPSAAPPKPPKPPMRPPSGIAPILRLVGLIAFAIVAVVVLVFVIKGCRDKGEEGAYRDYMANVSQVASESQTIGRELNTLLTTPGTDQAELEQRLNGFAQTSEQLVTSADSFDPPGPLTDEQEAVVEALELRVAGLRGLEDVFRRTADSDDADEAGRLLSAQAQRLAASDVIWDDRFRAPSRAELAAQGITGVQVPDSNFLITPELASAATLKPIWERLHGAETGGTPASGLHGNGIVQTVVLPSEQELSEDTETTIDASTDLAFEVTIENSGEFPETSVEVTLTIQKSPPIVKRQTVAIINAGEQKTVRFEDIGQPPFVQPTTIKVDVKPVPGEQNEANNVAEYPVIFSLG
jgi:CARDB